jgi:predicted dehydrogenase
MLDGAMDEALGAYVSGWITRRQTLGGGVLFSSSPHLLDVMLYLAGPARGAWMVGTRGGVEMEGEDTAACVIKFASGAIGVTRHTWASPGPRVWYTMQAVCQRARVTLTVHPQGDLASEGHRCRWHSRLVAQGERDEVLLESDEGLDLGPEIEHFLDCVDTRAVPQTGGRAAREVIALVLGAYQRAAEMGANV